MERFDILFWKAYEIVKGKKVKEQDVAFVQKSQQQFIEAMDDDFNTAMTLANLFKLSAKINAFNDKLVPLHSISRSAFEKMKKTFRVYVTDILGLKDEQSADNHQLADGLMQLVIDIRKKVREKKDYATSDVIRDELARLNIQLIDGKEGTTWTMKTE